MRHFVTASLLFATSALAHIKISAPLSFQVLDNLGNPQKTAPCGGAGTASNVVTTVTAGSQLTVTWNETVYHPGHFRISIAPNMNQFVTPTPVVTSNNCVSAPIEMNPVLPTIADGLFANHTSAMTAHSQTITVPMMSCDNCMLQLMQFMASHTPPCFYYQCAALRIVMPDAGTPDAGQPDAGQADAGVTDAGSTTTPDSGTQPGDAGTSGDGGVDPMTQGGCGCSTPVADVSLLALGLVFALRRRR